VAPWSLEAAVAEMPGSRLAAAAVEAAGAPLGSPAEAALSVLSGGSAGRASGMEHESGSVEDGKCTPRVMFSRPPLELKLGAGGSNLVASCPGLEEPTLEAEARGWRRPPWRQLHGAGGSKPGGFVPGAGGAHSGGLVSGIGRRATQPAMPSSAIGASGRGAHPSNSAN
jgi:hypothetical protein